MCLLGQSYIHEMNTWYPPYYKEIILTWAFWYEFKHTFSHKETTLCFHYLSRYHVCSLIPLNNDDNDDVDDDDNNNNAQFITQWSYYWCFIL